MEVYTLLKTGLNRQALFDWQIRARMAHPNDKVVRADTWTIEGHPDGLGGTFTLYACTMVFVKVELEKAEAQRQFDIEERQV